MKFLEKKKTMKESVTASMKKHTEAIQEQNGILRDLSDNIKTLGSRIEGFLCAKNTCTCKN